MKELTPSLQKMLEPVFGTKTAVRAYDCLSFRGPAETSLYTEKEAEIEMQKSKTY